MYIDLDSSMYLTDMISEDRNGGTNEVMRTSHK